MSSKYSKRSKVSVNVISSEGESDSDIELNNKTNDNNSDENDLSDNSLNNSNNDENEDNCVTNRENKSWADAINGILMTKSKKNTLLSKAKKDKDIEIGKRKSDELNSDLEFVAEDGNVVKSKETHNKKKIKKSKTNESVKRKRNKKMKISENEWEIMNKLKPNLNDKERERMLSSVATKGVVQLFNAVREQQQSIKNKMNEIGFSETKRDKAMNQFNKNQFLNKLDKKKQNNYENQKSDNNSKSKPSEDQKWKVLRDDFMIGAKMKDWDKESESDSNDGE